jgi:hypothetical protein
MGYYTQFKLKIVEGEGNVYDHKEEIGKITRYGGSPFEDELKWYEHEEDMLKYSKTCPDILFAVEGRGEEHGDHWIKYFKDGQMQRCNAVVSFEEYDPQKMK